MRKIHLTTVIVFSLVALLMILGSCTNDLPEVPDLSIEPVEKPAATPTATQIPEINIPPEELILKYYDYSERGVDNTESLTDTIKEKLGISMDLLHIKPDLLAEGAESVNGIIHLDNYEYSRLMDRRYSLFLPLNDYLEDNEIYQALPSAVKRAMKDNMGIIWGFPTEYDFSHTIRIYSGKVLEQDGGTVPGTLEDLTEFLEKAKASIEPGYVIMKTTPNSCLNSITDIAEVFGLRMQSGSTIIYDKTSGMYLDSVNTADIPGFLGYVSFLLDNDYLIFEEESGTTGYENALLLSEGKIASYMTEISRSGVSSQYYTYSLTDDKDRLSARFVDPGMIFLGKGTKNPSEVINSYINAFYSSNMGNILGRYGESGYTAEYSNDESVMLLSVDYEQVVKDVLAGKMPYSANLCGYGFYNDYFRSSEYQNDELVHIREETFFEYLDFRNKAFEDNQVDLIPIYKTISDYDRVHSREAMYSFRDVLADFMRGEISINDFMTEYERLNAAVGQKEFIEKLNAN